MHDDSSRLYRPTPDELTSEQRAVYNAIVGGDRSAENSFTLVDEEGRLCGPFNAMVIAPQIGDALSRLGEALRFRGTLPDRSREIVILTVAAAKQSKFELYAHTRAGRRLGLTDDELAHLLARRSAPTFDNTEAAVHELSLRLTTGAPLGADDYESFRERFGEAGLVEVSTLVGYYAMLALQLDLFGVQPPAD